VLSCDSGDNNVIFYEEHYMLLIDGAIDNQQLLPLGITSDNGSFEYNNKSSFPTLFNHNNIIMARTSNEIYLNENFQLSDYTDGTFRIHLEKEDESSEFSAYVYNPDFILKDKVNIFNITISNRDITIARTEISGDFNIIFNIEDEQGLPIEGVSVSMQYSLHENAIGEHHNNQGLLFRPSTRVDYSVSSIGTVRFTIELLDGTVIQEWIESDIQGMGSFYFTPQQDEITGGLQLYKYSMEILEQNEDDGRSDDFSPPSPTSNSLSYNYPNPF
tara:strand:+ start:28 stop:846 length:819 start_codon:yes stop_codon:yes gene_type:complete